MDNRLLYEYQKSQQNNIPLQNNMLLNTNPFFVNNMQYSPQQMQQMQQLKEIQHIKQLEKLNDMEITMDKDKIKESIIKPIKIEKSKDAKELESKFKNVESQYIDKKKKDYGPEIHKYWQSRTNEPYKNILKNENYTKTYKDKDDLIVHRVTVKDKEGVTEELSKMNEKLEKHNNELKVIYSTDQENEHKKKFDYNHVYKYRVKYDPKGHDTLKQDKVKYYKEKQKKEEEGKKKKDSILESLVNDGIFNQDELAGIDINNIEESQPQQSSKKQMYLDRKNKNKK